MSAPEILGFYIQCYDITNLKIIKNQIVSLDDKLLGQLNIDRNFFGTFHDFLVDKNEKIYIIFDKSRQKSGVSGRDHMPFSQMNFDNIFLFAIDSLLKPIGLRMVAERSFSNDDDALFCPDNYNRKRGYFACTEMKNEGIAVKFLHTMPDFGIYEYIYSYVDFELLSKTLIFTK